jgi:hypothetical protein
MRRGIVLAALALALLPASASANTVLRVDGASGVDTGNCRSSPCKTINYAVAQSESVPDLVTIDVASGNYTESVMLGAADSGLTISGVGSGGDPANSTIITGTGAVATVLTSVAGSASSLALNHLRLVVPPGGTVPAVAGSGGTDLALNDVAVDSAATSVGIVTGGDVDWTGGSLTMSQSTSSTGIQTTAGAVTLTNVAVTVAGTAPAIVGAPVSLDSSPVTVTNTTASAPAIIVSSAASLTVVNSPIDLKSNGFAIEAGGQVSVSGSAITLEGTTGSAPAIVDNAGPGLPLSVNGASIDVKGQGIGVLESSGASATLSNVQVKLENAADTAPAVEISGRGSVLSQVTVSDAGSAPVLIDTGSLAVTDSSIASSTTSATPAVILQGSSPSGSDVSFTRSTVSEPVATAPALTAQGVNLAIDSSEILGGHVGISFGATGGVARTLTVASSTVDAGALGTRDALPLGSLQASADSTAGSAATVNIEGSILLEPPQAVVGGAPGRATVNCTNTEVPPTVQTASATQGAINCGATNGNTFTPSPSSIFVNPATGYTLNPSWSGVDSVPDGAIALPAPFSDSATDLVGDPRVLNGVGTCTAGMRDKGAIELMGHSGTVPAPVISGPSTVSNRKAAKFTAVARNVQGVTVTFAWHTSDGANGPGATFLHRFSRTGKRNVTVTATGAAGCVASTTKRVVVEAGAVISRLRISPKRFAVAHGATISYRDSTIAKTTFTVQRLTGRRHGKAMYRPVGHFTHRDKPGGQRIRFEGRAGGHRLAPGIYRLKAVPRNAGGSGSPAFLKFTITG